MSSPQKKRGRPKGSATRAATPGRKRAKEFLDLVFESDVKKTHAARAIAEKYGVETYQIFKDSGRHYQFLTDEAWQEAEQAAREYDVRRSIAEMGPHLPGDGIACLYRAAIAGLKLR